MEATIGIMSDIKGVDAPSPGPKKKKKKNTMLQTCVIKTHHSYNTIRYVTLPQQLASICPALF